MPDSNKSGVPAARRALPIETFDNRTGGDALFRAVGHPLASEPARALVARLKAAGKIAVYDPFGAFATLTALQDFSGIEIVGLYGRDAKHLGRRVGTRTVEPISAIAASGAACVLVTAFDADPLVAQIRHWLPKGAEIVTLDAMRIPATLLTDRKHYLSTYNFVTNLVLFCEGPRRHTRLVSANYWSGYGAKNVRAWFCLFSADGSTLATWEEKLADGVSAFVVDSRAIAKRFSLGAFEGQLFVHMIDVTGHDVLKYALDFWSDSELTCTHDANPWPSDYYAGIPAPDAGEKVRVWVQNCHSCTIPADGVRFARMGSDAWVPMKAPIPAFGMRAVDVGELLPELAWPDQIEMDAGKYVVRPRYEVERAGKRHVAHANVERSDLKPDPDIVALGPLFGKGFILPAPILPQGEFESVALPTPMARGQSNLPLVARFYDASGAPAGERFLGNLPRAHATRVETDALKLPSGYGHMEFSYDFREGGGGDGWIHALFRYRRRQDPAHGADTSFGSHIFNTALVFKNEPQSYIGRPPGLTTRLFLRLGSDGHDAMCHLIYPASTPWHATSDTLLELHDAAGTKIAEAKLAIPCSGSRLWRAGETFAPADLARAGDGGYVLIRDRTCRLFGYHGLRAADGRFSLDHMFGF